MRKPKIRRHFTAAAPTISTQQIMNLVSHDVSVGSLGVAAAVVAVEIVVFVVAYTFTVETTSN